VHRLDRETSGLLCFAKSFAVKRHLQAQFAARTAERVYVAVVEGRLTPPTGTLEARLVEDRTLRVRATRDAQAGREAITHYRVLDHRGDTTLVELGLVTGRRGQLRAQLAALGHPIVGDLEHGGRPTPVRRLCLHATRLAFVMPGGGRRSFESPVPPAFSRA
jgi:23S rRNA-/tRNA-specific pseudouridylate synthase